MRRLYYLFIGLLLPVWLAAQTNITQTEYWYDGDYNSVKQQVVIGNNALLADLLDVSTLEPGLHTFTIRFKDNRGIWGSVLTKFFTYSPETSPGIHLISELEYWFNGDYSSVVKTTLTPEASVDLNSLLNVSGLKNGLHTFSCRFKDNRGLWSAPLINFFVKEPESGIKQITALEYWYNNDYGNAIVNTFTPTTLLHINEMLDLSSLGEGFHFVNLRLKDTDGKWGPATSWYFIKESNDVSPMLLRVTAMEYWFDGNYSTVQNNTVTPSVQIDLNTQLNVSALNDGLHMISCRFRDENSKWSPAYSKWFLKHLPLGTPDLKGIVNIEYWIDGDHSQAVKETIPATSDYLVDVQLNVATVGEGLHTLTYRFQDEAGNWSPGVTSLFCVYDDETVTNDNKITGYRYWANSNMASATEVLLSVPAQSLAMDDVIDISRLPGGEQLISIQFRDEQGQWSSAVSKTYRKEVNPAVSISASSLTICTGSPVSFSADIFDADVIEWQFGDGSTSAELAPTHIYSEGGTYDVTVTVTHSDSMKTAYNSIDGGITVYPSYNVWMGDVNTIFYDSFENETLGTAPSEWTLKYNGTGTANQVVVDNPVKKGLKAFQMEGQSSWAAEFYKRFAGLSNEVTLEAWVNCEKILSGLAGSIGLGNFDVGTWGTRTSRLQFYAGKISATYSGGSTYEIMNYNPGTWYHVRIVHDLNNLTYRVYINNTLASGNNGTEIITDFPMHPTVGTQDIMLAAGNSGTTKMFFDDIKLYQPKPIDVCASQLPYIFGSQSINTPGTYTETFQTVSGCDSTVTLMLDLTPVYDPTIDVVDDIYVTEYAELNIPLTGISDGNSCEIIPLAFTLTSSNPEAIQSYQFSYTDGESTGLLKIILSPEANGESTITLEVNNAVDNRMTSQTFKLSLSFPVGINYPTGSDIIKVYPNPTSGLVHIEIPESHESSITITVMDITGEAVLQQEVNATGKIPVDLSILKNGIYFIRLQNRRTQIIHKIIVSH